ncbi:MAG TPA: electron transport complex subunit RsxA, partial [Thermodesulforhabdus norvegica]|nr:electron transport complex subunit RsxA [Thermodesulforhabdus norvegica]
MSDYLLIIVSAVLVKNILLARYLGNCPFLGVSNRMDTATGMAMAVVFVMTAAVAITWCVQRFILVPYGLEYLQTIAFILVIATLVQLVEMFLQKSVPALYRMLGIFLPLITTNCAVLGAAVLVIQNKYDFAKGVVFGFASAIGFGLALILMTGLRERYQFQP